MATISFTVSDETKARIADYFGKGYRQMIRVDGKMVANPQTKAQYAKAQVADLIKKEMKRGLEEIERNKIVIPEEEIL